MINWILIACVIIGIAILWILFGIVFPFFLIKWYMRSSKLLKSKKLLKLSKKLKNKDKEKTLRNVYRYIIKNYKGNPYQFIPTNLLNLRNFTLKDMLKKRRFLWCYSHVKLLSGLLIATKQFKKKDIKIKWKIGRYMSIHQYLIIKVRGEKYKVDAFYKIFKKI